MLRFSSSPFIAGFARSQASRDKIVNPEEGAVYQEEVVDQKEIVEEVHHEQFSSGRHAAKKKAIASGLYWESSCGSSLDDARM